MFKVGNEVSYGLLGKCVVAGVETKELSSGPVEFYIIRSVKNPIAARKSNPNEPAIFVPVADAIKKGLRSLMTKEEVERNLQILSEPDYHFELNQTWVTKQRLLEETLRKEGGSGLVKVVGHLYVAIKRDMVPPPEVLRFYETVFRVLIREVAEILELSMKETEILITKALKNKLLAYN